MNLYFLDGGIRRHKQRVTLDDLGIVNAIQYVGVVIRLTSVDIHVKVFAGIFRMKVELTGGMDTPGLEASVG